MKAIKMTEERQNKILPNNIKETDVLSNNAKKTLATIMNYFAILDIAKYSKYLVCPNSVLRKAVGIRNNDLIIAVQELIDCDLIERQVGHKRVEGEKATASVYKVIWENLTKPIKKKNTFEELFSEFLKSSETPLGTTDADIDTDTESDIDIESEFDNEIEDDNEIEIEDDVEIDNEIEEIKQMSILNENIEINKDLNEKEMNDIKLNIYEELKKEVETNLVGTDKKELTNNYYNILDKMRRQQAILGKNYTRIRLYIDRIFNEKLELIQTLVATT